MTKSLTDSQKVSVWPFIASKIFPRSSDHGDRDADPLLLLAFGRGLPPPDPRRHFESAFTAGAERRVVSGSASGKEV